MNIRLLTSGASQCAVAIGADVKVSGVVLTRHRSADRALPTIRYPSWTATVHIGVDVGTYPFGDEKEDFLFFLGRMHPTKGVREAIEVARKAGRPLIIASKCSEEAEVRHLEDEIRPMLGQDVTFLGEVRGSRKRALLARASALLFPIQWPEPFGLVMVEAMACGTPVVATNRRAVPEVVEDGVSGFIRDGLAELADACNPTRDLDPATIRGYASNRFDGSRMTAGYEDAYRRVLDESTHSARRLAIEAS